MDLDQMKLRKQQVKNVLESPYNEIERLRRSNAALKGVITKLKKERAAMKRKGTFNDGYVEGFSDGRIAQQLESRDGGVSDLI